MDILARWFGWSAPVGRGFYVRTGVALMLLRYGVDALVTWWAAGHWLTPLEFLSPLLETRMRVLGGAPEWIPWALAGWGLLFLWVAVSMSVRRAIDAGRTPALGLLVLVPGFNLVVIAFLALAPPSDTASRFGATSAVAELHRVRSAIMGVVAGVALATVATVTSVFLFEAYGAALFLGTPVMMGVVSAYIFNRPAPRSTGDTRGVAILCVVASGLVLMLFALEGVLCLAFATPVAIAGSVLGAMVGRLLAVRSPSGARADVTASILALAAVLGAESRLAPDVHRMVETVVEIEAPPTDVWPHVVGFSDITEPLPWYNRLGIAAPLRARIEGEGIGAVRHCEFTTGAFVEPITLWDPPHHLAFDVVRQPPPLIELSPYARIDAPHLEDAVVSKRGEFRLTALSGGRTRLVGRTWYTLRMFPEVYFGLWTDTLIHRIHERVLRHIATLAED